MKNGPLLVAQLAANGSVKRVTIDLNVKMKIDLLLPRTKKLCNIRHEVKSQRRKTRETIFIRINQMNINYKANTKGCNVVYVVP